MKLGQDFFDDKSSFLSLSKDLSLIVNKILRNDNLLKLLYYTEKDCLKGEKLTDAQKMGMLHKQIKIVPRILIEQECPNYIVITFDNFTPNAKNPQFRDCNINFDILCHPDHWSLGDFSLRPYKIAGELDAMFNNKKLTGIGELNFMGSGNLVLDDTMMGLTLVYRAIHGIEDKINPLIN